MACFTMVTIQLDDSEINRAAREELELPLTGDLDSVDVRRVKVEAGVIKARREIRRIAPNAVIRRVGNKLTVNVTV